MASHRQVEFAIAVEVPDDDIAAGRNTRVRHLRLKCAIAVAEQDGYGRAIPVGDCQVEISIAIEVAYGNRFSSFADGIV